MTSKRSADAGPGTKKTKITDFFSVQRKVRSTKNGDSAGDAGDAGAKSGAEKSGNGLFVGDQDDQVTPRAATEADPPKDTADADYAEFCRRYDFNKAQWVESLSPEERELLDLEIEHLHVTWLAMLHKTLTRPYFLQLKRFLAAQRSKTVFPPPDRIYSWSHLTPVPELRCLILGQDPYHNFNQAHGLAFSVLEPTKPPPSLKNIYKALAADYPQFQAPDWSKGGGGNLTGWARQGVLLLNTCLTVEAHKANSHSKQGWESFTAEVINCAIKHHAHGGFVVMAWGTPAQNSLGRFETLKSSQFLVLKTFHPSPFSAAKGFFTAQHFRKCNEWLQRHGRPQIDWALVPNTSIFTST